MKDKKDKLTCQDLEWLRYIAAYFEVWVNWSQDLKLIAEAAYFRRASSARSHQRFVRLQKLGLVSNEGTPILGGGMAFPLTDEGKKLVDQADQAV